MQDFLRAVESQGIPVTDDLQDLKTGHGACHWEKWINRDTGRRSDSAHAYIHSTRAHHSNLHLVCNTKVEKVIMEGGRAVGVKAVPTKPLTPGQDQAKVYRARKQIVSFFFFFVAEASWVGGFRLQASDPKLQPRPPTFKTLIDTNTIKGH